MFVVRTYSKSKINDKKINAKRTLKQKKNWNAQYFSNLFFVVVFVSTINSKAADGGVKSKSQTTTPSGKHAGTRGVRSSNEDNIMEKTPLVQVYFTYLCYYVLELFGHFREFLRRVGIEKRKGAVDNNTKVSYI